MSKRCTYLALPLARRWTEARVGVTLRRAMTLDAGLTCVDMAAAEVSLS